MTLLSLPHLLLNPRNLDAPVKEEDDFASLFGDLGDTKK